MRIFLVSLALVILTALPLAAQAPVPASGTPQVSVSATIVVIDREALTRAGVSHLVLGDGRIQLTSSNGRRPSRSVRIAVAADGLGVQAFLDLAREQRWVRSEHTQQVTVVSGSEASMSSATLRMGGMGARITGPSLSVAPSVLSDGSVHLRVSAEVVDVATDGWGYPLDGSPVAARTELVVADGEEAIVASGSKVETSRRVGLLHLSSRERDREFLVTITPRIVAAP